MKRLSYGIIGCGMIAQMHAQSVLHDGRAELTAVCDANLENGRAFAARHGAKHAYTSVEDMLAIEKLDVVSVCTPSGLHGEGTLAALRHGVHVLCEKPLEIDAGNMTEMIETAKASGLWLGCVFPNRTNKGLQRAKVVADSGILGQMVLAECHYTGYRSPAYFATSNWKGTKRLDGGGCLMNQGIHAIDTFLWLTGDFSSVYGVSATMLRDIEVEDLAMGLIEFQNGGKGVLVGTTLSNIPEQAPEGDRIKVEFEKGSLLYAEGHVYQYLRHGDHVEKRCLDDNPDSEVISAASDPALLDFDSHSYIVSDMISAVSEGRPPCIPGESARLGVDLVLALYESSRTGQKVFR